MRRDGLALGGTESHVICRWIARLTSFPNSVWERISAKLCFAISKAEFCGTGVPKPELGNK